MSRVTCRWWTVLRWSVVVAVVAMTIGPVHLTSAQILRYGDSVERLSGLERAVARTYGSLPFGSALMDAYVFAFDTDANARAGLETVHDESASAIPADAAIPIDELGTETYAYTREYLGSITTDVLTVNGPYLYIVVITSYIPDLDTVALATTTIQAMIAAEASEGVGDYAFDGSSTGGLWDKLPPGAGVSPPDFHADMDVQLYPEPEVAGDAPEPTEEESDSDGFDFSTLDGIQRVVSRSYSRDMSVLASPETAPATTYFMAALVAEFDNADNAAAALEPLYAQAQSGFGDDLSISLESIDPGDVGDQAVAGFGVAEEEGVSYEVALLIVQADTYMYAVFAVGIGTDTGVLEMAPAVTEAMLEAEAGSGDGEYDDSGVFMTGGLWDKLPADGDAVLNGLVPASDEQTYP